MRTDHSQNLGNILLVANYKSDVGYAWWLMENFWVQIADLFVARGRKIFLIYPEINDVPISIRESAIQIYQHDFADSSKLARCKLKQLIRQNDITSIYLTDKPYLSKFYFVLRTWGIRKIAMHDHIPGDRAPLPLPRRLFKKAMHRLQIFSCDNYIGVSKFVYNRFIRVGCIPVSKCCYVLNGIRPIVVDPRFRFYANEQFAIPKDSIIVISTGRATFYKGLDTILKCANILINDHHRQNVYFLHCGDGPDLGRFNKMSHDLNLTNRFIFAGRRNDIPQILQSCQIGMQASTGEAFSLSILEYLGAGLATIVPNNSGNSEAIEDNINGFLYRTGDAQEATMLVERLMDDEGLRLRVGTNAIKSVKDRFNLERMNRDFRRVIVNCL